MQQLLSPAGIAIVGASDNSDRIGGHAVRALRDFGYAGGVYPVNPRYESVMGLPCFSSVRDVPETCDVALVLVRAALVPSVIRDCGARGIPYAVVVSAGFEEMGDSGAEAYAALKREVEETGVRVIGPNCQGVLNLADKVYCGFGAIFRESGLRTGPMAMVTQSGGFGYAMAGLAEELGTGFNYIISTGNEVDVDAVEALEYLLSREDVKAASTYLEGVSDGEAFRRLGETALRARKPVLVWKVGRSEAGQRAAVSHTANLTSRDEFYRAAFRSGGFIEIGDLYDLVDIDRVWNHGTSSSGNGVAIVSISGGAGVAIADLCEEAGLRVAELAATTREGLKSLLPPFGSTRNPVDVTANIFNEVENYEAVCRALAEDPAVDQLLIANAAVSGGTAEAVAAALVNVARGTRAPVTVTWSPRAGTADAGLRLLRENKIAVFETPRRLVGAVAAATHFLEQCESANGREEASTVSAAANDDGLAAMMRGDTDGARALLEAYGIPVVEGVSCSFDELDGMAALPLPPPVVAKIEIAQVEHKSDAGLIRIGVSSVEELREWASHRLAEHARDAQSAARIRLEQQLQGTEMIVGAVSDPTFGPLVMVGTGGIYAEVLQDTAYDFAPLGREQSLALVQRTRTWPILHGLRGQAPGDVDSLVDAVARLSLLAYELGGYVEEIEVNPLFVLPRGRGVRAADVLVVPKPGATIGHPR